MQWPLTVVDKKIPMPRCLLQTMGQRSWVASILQLRNVLPDCDLQGLSDSKQPKTAAILQSLGGLPGSLASVHLSLTLKDSSEILLNLSNTWRTTGREPVHLPSLYRGTQSLHYIPDILHIPAQPLLECLVRCSFLLFLMNGKIILTLTSLPIKKIILR